MEIRHPWHDHQLFLSDEAKFGDYCYICKTEFDGNPFYACVDCKYYVHKSCAQLPLKIQHHFHPPHPLSLCFGDDFACDSCNKRFQNELRFRCSDCNFDLDVKCALMSDIDTEGKEFIRHFTHQHPLTICSKDGDNPLNCFACKKTSSDLIYGCTPCDYFLHKSCAEISTHVLHAMHPQHPLSLGVKFGSCNYCRIYDYTLKYYCTFCDFFLDASCFIESTKNAQNSERSCLLCGKQHLDSDSCVDSMYFINQSCIQLPKEIEHEFHSHKLLLWIDQKYFGCDSCHKWFVWLSYYSCNECNFRMDVKCALMPSIQYEESNESIWPVIPPHFNHQHPLQLIREVNDINCTACHSTKLSPIYGCIRCEYFLHQSCLELPIQIQHPLHDSHVLTIQHLPVHERYVMIKPRHLQRVPGNFCQVCCRKYDGFAFGCTQCRFFIGIECIFELGLILPVVHKCHHHLLYLIEKSSCDQHYQCNADDTYCQFSEESSEFKLTKSYSLRCIECDYTLHFLCGPLPCTIKHKSHLHVLKLVDSIVEDDSDEHYCDICEEIRNPRLCVYYCENCKFFAHIHCVISEIINVFKNNTEKVELRIVGDLRLENVINLSHDNLRRELLLDILEHVDGVDGADGKRWPRIYFPGAMLFLRKEYPWDAKRFLIEEEDPWNTIEENLNSEVNTMNIIEELSFYNDDISLKIWEILKLFKPDTEYHIQRDECELPVIVVEGYKITSNFADIFRTLVKNYGNFVHNSRLPEKVKPIFLYFLCRVLESMYRTFVVDITEKQLFTWLYYIKRMKNCGFDLEFVNPFLDRITKSYFGLRAMKFENEVPGMLDQEIVNLEQKISDIKTQLEELKWHRQQHRIGKIAEESAVMQEFFTEAKKLKWNRASEGIF